MRNLVIREEIIEDMKIFTKSRDHYANLGIPFRRGYLFFGSPGSGKTSLINALASELKYSISLINMSDKLMDDSRFLHLMNKAPPNTIIGRLNCEKFQNSHFQVEI